MTEAKKPERRRINLEIPADLKAIYANFAIITHSPWEIFVDIAQIMPNVPKARVQARIVMTPTNAKMLMKAMQENIERYETKHGEIKLPPRPATLADQLFSSIGPGGDLDSNAKDETENNDDE
jgi:hypothetical protein